MQLEIFLSQTKDRLFSGQEAEDPNSTHRLAQHRGKSGTLYTHIKSKDEYGVQDNVDDCTDHGGQHADFRKALCGNKGVHTHHNQHKDRAENVDPGIVQCIRQRRFTGTEHHQKLRCKNVENNGQYNRQHKQQRKAVAHDLFRCLVVLLAHENGSTGCATGACQHGKGIDQHQDRHKESCTG